MTSANLHAVQSAISAAQPVPETLYQTVARLAALSPLEYEQARKKEANRLGIDRVSVLDAEIEKARGSDSKRRDKKELYPVVTPWASPVDGAALLEKILTTVKCFIVCSEETAVAATLWIAFTWFVDHAQVAPLAIITAPEKRCGKTQMLSLIGKLSRRPLVASNISPSAIFRVVERDAPTLLIDEADTFLRDNEEARGILNSGHTRTSAYTIRNVGDDHEPTTFCTWGAKVLCGIGTLPDTLMDRAVVLELRRKLPHETVERLRHADAALFDRLASMMARYAEDNGLAVATSRPALPDKLNDRAQDNWETLLAIADHAGNGWAERARSVAVALSGGEQDTVPLSTELLADIREVFGMRERLSTKDLLEELTADDLKHWATYNRGKPITPRQLAKRLEGYGIKPDTLSFSGIKAKGYKREWFDDAFTRYLSSPSGDTPEMSVEALPFAAKPQPETERAVTDKKAVTVTFPVSVTKNTLKSPQDNGSTDKVGLLEGDVAEERAAIMEFDAGLPREQAEALARADILCDSMGGDEHDPSPHLTTWPVNKC